MKKIYLLLAVLTAAFVFIGCDQLNDSTSTQPLNESTSVTVEELALQAASVNALLLPNNSSAGLLGYTLLDESTDDPIIGDDVSELDMYLELMSQFLGNDNGLSVTQETSDRLEFDYKVTYSITTLYEGLKIFTLYYNMTQPVADEATDDTPTTEDETPTTEDGEVITTSFGQGHGQFRIPCIEHDDEAITALIDGILVDGETETSLEGALIQNDTEEILRLYAYVDEDNFVRVSVKTDTEDQTKKFFYQVVENDILVSESKIRTSIEDGKIHIRLELFEGSMYTEFIARQETIDDVTRIHIRYQIVQDQVVLESGNVHIVGTYDELTGETTFEYNVLPDGFTNAHLYQFQHHCGPYGSQDKEGNAYNHGNDNGHGNKSGHRGGGMWNPDDGFNDDDTEPATTVEVPAQSIL